MDILSYILGKKAGGGGGEAVLINKSISANGTYNASSDSADGYKKVVVAVPNSYAAGDEGKVVSNGALVSQTSASYTSNGTYDTTLVNEVEVDVAIVDPDFTKFLEGTLTNFSNSSATKVRMHCFRQFLALTSVTMSAVTNVEMAGFYECKNLESATFASLTTVEGLAFRSCEKLTTLNAPLLTNLAYGGTTTETFANCYKLTSAGISSFMHNVTNTGQSCFNNCRALTYYCNGVKTSGMPSNIFLGCSALATVDTKESTVSSQAFKDTALSLLILRAGSVASMANINAFANTPFASGGAGGDIYVPSALIDSYKAATNWSTVNGYGTITWHAIEGSIYETQYADGTPIT